jgi:hypothetical protein
MHPLNNSLTLCLNVCNNDLKLNNTLQDIMKIYQRECKGKCGIVSSQQKSLADDLIDGEIVTRPVWKCICCGHEEKRIVCKSTKSKRIEAFLESKLNQMLVAHAVENENDHC